MRANMSKLTIVLLIFSCLAQSWAFDQKEDWANATSLYNFTVNDIQGNPVHLSRYEGNCTLVVNVASKCGLTKINYEQLIDLEKKYASQGLVIVVFPCNQFANQEPGTNDEIKSFAEERGATLGDKFLLCAKGNVNGPDAHPMYKWLKSKKKHEDEEDITWNFTKFLVAKNGKFEDQRSGRWAPKINPKKIEDQIKKCLK